SIVISNGGKLVEQIQRDGGIHIKYNICSKNPLSAVFRIFGLRKIVKKIKPDILHVRSRVPAWLVNFANKSLRIKVVSTVHGFNSVGYYSKIMQEADEVICVSNAIKEYIIKNYQTEERKITVIPRGIDTQKFNKNSLDINFIENFKKEFDLENSFIVTSVGRVTQLKGYEDFIGAVAILKKSISNIKGVIVGGVREDKMKYFESLKQKVNELKLDSNIKFALSQTKVAEIYSLSDVVVSSSKKPESFGRSVAEAISLNAPVVATNHGGVKDIIIEGENGYLSEVDNINLLAQTILKASKLKFNGLKYIEENFSLEQMVEKTIYVYKKVLK
ncbi:MAG: glycosyltransferase family 4 protein, partial [Campylobacteraceae bacterium]|nr:glycosyltransferase family 4 protein [Campylobacteraceae bacterium]